MNKKNPTEMEYREVMLPKIGRIMAPVHLSDAEIIAELVETEDSKPGRKPRKAKA